MSSEGVPELSVDGRGLRIVVIAGMWHTEISNGLLAGATRALDAAGATHTVVRVPGSFELPVAALAALENGADAVVALGVIIRGGTPHFEYVSSAATTGLMDVAIRVGKPIGFGVLTLDDEKQGLDRAGLEGSKEDKGKEAAEAAIAAARVLRRLHEPADFARVR
ncbi:6,7-dimethyl-8-ribityllumazine synthase [Okibacterium endophyticum]